ncbi:FAD-dependent oxidoreductase [Amnibacterium flavum]|uniref:FAD-binding domain-containing protein n=1 Tax=Amnibacterium flavum TaxID=2173173 RepID=A0A2V1HNW7_9MICO|nr:FAD-dependent oxidoreductase [Amnibacterium flavum]PVZ94296.1 hypothetical protein DDQ50_11210 [Amnibacterium flavum]
MTRPEPTPTPVDPRNEGTTCVIAGGGPAGIMLGLLLARSGIRVTVLEKHLDFLRDFRGDTVHPTTQGILDELGLTAAFERIVRGRVDSVTMGTADSVILNARIAGAAPWARFRSIALAPQWDFLDLLTEHASHYPGFDLRLGAECTGVLRSARTGAVTGVRYRDEAGDHELPAVLTVAADGRRSTIRSAVDSPLIDLGAPMDVLWLRLPRRDSDGAGLRGVLGSGDLAVAIDRGDYWQLAYLIPKGSFAAVRARGIDVLRTRLVALLPFLVDRVAAVDWDDVKMLEVGLSRLQRWYSPGVLAIGDAAHTMSPIGGVGINLAVQDAVAAARILAPVLLRAQDDPSRFRRTLNPRPLARVQRRRLPPAVLVQRIQRTAQARVIDRVLTNGTVRLPFLLAADLRNNGLVARLIVRLLLYGIRPERIPPAVP